MSKQFDPEPPGGRKWAPAPAVEPLNKPQVVRENELTLDANPSDAPCCVKLEDAQGASILFQTDWDWPPVAGLFGWSTKHNDPANGDECPGGPYTDGTIDCPTCGKKTIEFICEARQWLDDHDGETCENPGYELSKGGA